ncbi:hydroxymethylbilane synthase [Halobacteriales archaeon QH_3_68_24]|nr:MAG: hydroxymethylbilane synthase [Halobacteriales archaeon QH_3_68_24]
MSTRGRTIRLGTRGSDLARRQAATVADRLTDRRFEVDIVTVETTGDRVTDELIHRLGKTGAFVRDLDEEVLSGEIDAAVHSTKDMPTEMPEDLVVAGVPERGIPGDVLVTPDGASLSALAEGATVGTASLRRGAQVLAERPDLAIEPLRGNVDTRVEKLLAPSRQREHQRRLEAESDEGLSEYDDPDGEADDAGDTDGDENEPAFDRTVEEWFDDLSETERRSLEREVDTEYDAIVLAEVGLERSGLLHHIPHQRLPPETFVPAPGQGALAVTAREGDLAEELRSVLDHPHTRVETTVERTVLETLGGGCVAPVGIRAVLQGPVVRTTVRVLDREGEEQVRATRELPVDRHAAAAHAFATDLADRGAADIIERARRDADIESGGTREETGDDS